jgi:hypothetical protein
MVRGLALTVLLSCSLFAELVYAGTCPEGLQLQQWRQQRAILRDQVKANVYDPTVALQWRNKFHANEAKYPALFLDQEIRNFPLTGDAFCLVWAMKIASGKDLNYTPYTDGKFDLTLGGKKIRDRISADELLAIAKSLR